MPAFFLLPLAVFAVGGWFAMRSRLAFDDLLDRYARHPEAWAGGPRPTGWNRSYQFSRIVGRWIYHPPEWASRDAKAMRLLAEMRSLNRRFLLVMAALPIAFLDAVVAFAVTR